MPNQVHRQVRRPTRRPEHADRSNLTDTAPRRVWQHDGYGSTTGVAARRERRYAQRSGMLRLTARQVSHSHAELKHAGECGLGPTLRSMVAPVESVPRVAHSHSPRSAHQYSRPRNQQIRITHGAAVGPARKGRHGAAPARPPDVRYHVYHKPRKSHSTSRCKSTPLNFVSRSRRHALRSRASTAPHSPGQSVTPRRGRPFRASAALRYRHARLRAADVFSQGSITIPRAGPSSVYVNLAVSEAFHIGNSRLFPASSRNLEQL